MERYFLPAGLPAGLLPADFGFAVCRCFEDSLFFAASAPLAPALLDFMGMLEDWIYYDIPEHRARNLWEGKYRGQKQKWIALEFLGADMDIDLEAFDHPEFSRWKWIVIDELLDYVVPFKRDVYKRVMEEFRPYARELARRK